METLYRKVAVSERKPKESGYYFIINSQRQQRHVHFNCEVNEWKGAWETEYWLEEIPDNSHQLEKLEADKVELLEALQDIQDELENGDTPKVYKIESLIQKHKK